jgi:hypothetical protein
MPKMHSVIYTLKDFVDFKFIMLRSPRLNQPFREEQTVSKEIEQLLKDLEKARELLRTAERRLTEDYAR